MKDKAKDKTKKSEEKKKADKKHRDDLKEQKAPKDQKIPKDQKDEKKKKGKKRHKEEKDVLKGQLLEKKDPKEAADSGFLEKPDPKEAADSGFPEEPDSKRAAGSGAPVRQHENAGTAADRKENGRKTAADNTVDSRKSTGAVPEKTAAVRRRRRGDQRTGSTDAGEREAQALIFRALGDESRLQILDILGEQEMCAADLLKLLPIVQSTLSHHMKILCEAGLVICRKQGRWSYYTVNRQVFEEAADRLRERFE